MFYVPDSSQIFEFCTDWGRFTRSGLNVLDDEAKSRQHMPVLAKAAAIPVQEMGLIKNKENTSEARLIETDFTQTLPSLRDRSKPAVNINGGLTISHGAKKLNPPVKRAVKTNFRFDHLEIEAATAETMANTKNWIIAESNIKTTDGSEPLFTDAVTSNSKDIPYGEPK